MPSTFFGLTIAGSGLNAYQAAVNNAANNVSNLDTEGYSRQKVEMKSGRAIRVHQQYGSMGTGVIADNIIQLRDKYYDDKYWNNQSRYGLYEKKTYYMTQIEDYFKDNTATPGFNTIYTKMFNALDSVKSNASDKSVRNEFISDAKELTDYFNHISGNLKEMQTGINDEIKTTVDEINSISKKISIINREINVLEQQGGHANELRDQRALLVDELSKIIPVTTEENKVHNTNFPDMYTGATEYYVKLNGKNLVNNFTYNELTTDVRKYRNSQSDADGLYDVVWKDSGEKIPMNSSAMSGELKAMFDLMDGNNDENLKGYVAAASTGSVTINYPSCKDINNLNLPVQGSFTVLNKVYNYSGFSVNTDANGQITGMTFTLDHASIDTATINDMQGAKLEVGSSNDYKGVAYYQNQMNQFLRAFSESFNIIEKNAEDSYGNKAGVIFTATGASDNKELGFTDSVKGQEKTYNFSGDACDDTYYLMTAENVKISSKVQADSGLFGTKTYTEAADGTHIDNGAEASDIISKLLNLESKEKIFRQSGGSEFLKCIYADITVDSQECSVFEKNYKSISNSIAKQRKSVSGVDEDDESVDLVKFQNAYNLASKTIQVLNEMYDRLITQTGV